MAAGTCASTALTTAALGGGSSGNGGGASSRSSDLVVESDVRGVAVSSLDTDMTGANDDVNGLPLSYEPARAGLTS